MTDEGRRERLTDIYAITHSFHFWYEPMVSRLIARDGDYPGNSGQGKTARDYPRDPDQADSGRVCLESVVGFSATEICPR